MNTTIDLKTAKTIEAMNQKINHMDNAVTDFFNKMSDVLVITRYIRSFIPSPHSDQSFCVFSLSTSIAFCT